VKRGAIAGRALSAAGRSSTNPATARKAEKKKRGEAARTLGNSCAAARNPFNDLCAGLQHRPSIPAGCRKRKHQRKSPPQWEGFILFEKADP
jgi:hypothetical protein